MNEDIFIKFGTLIDIGHTTAAVAQYPTFGEIRDGGSRHLRFEFFRISRLPLQIFV